MKIETLSDFLSTRAGFLTSQRHDDSGLTWDKNPVPNGNPGSRFALSSQRGEHSTFKITGRRDRWVYERLIDSALTRSGAETPKK